MFMLSKVWFAGWALSALSWAAPCVAQAEPDWHPPPARLGAASASVLTLHRSPQHRLGHGYPPWLQTHPAPASLSGHTDLSLSSLHPGHTVRLGARMDATPNIEALLRKLRLAPTITVRVEYHF
jgi:hypothetical protein